MKHLFISGLILMMSWTAHATNQEAKLLRSQLTSFNFDIGSNLEKRQINSGALTIDLEKNVVELTLIPSFHCPKAFACIQVMPAPIVVTLPLQSIEQGSCNTTIYKASRDLRPVDGLLETLTIVDNSLNQCQTLLPLNPIDVHYFLEGGEQRLPSNQPKSRRHSFGGTPLTPEF